MTPALPSAWTQGSLDRQRIHRAAVPQRQVRKGLSARVHERHGGTHFAHEVLQHLQHTPFSSPLEYRTPNETYFEALATSTVVAA